MTNIDEKALKLYKENENLVYFCLKKYGLEFDEDYQQMARIGLWNACKSFDISKEFKFSTYAVHVINNEVFKQFRKINAKKERTAVVISLNEKISNNGTTKDIENLTYEDSLADSKDYYESFIIKDVIKQVYDKLSKEEQKLFILYFVEDKTQQEISKKLNLSQSYISRLLKKLKNKFKNAII